MLLFVLKTLWKNLSGFCLCAIDHWLVGQVVPDNNDCKKSLCSIKYFVLLEKKKIKV